MYKIKQLPEDFFVREIARHEFREKGDYAYYIMRKKNYTTQRAAERVADFLGVKREDFSYAGLKDRNAVTEQFVSIRSRESPTEIKLPDIELKLLGRGYVKIGIGELDGNEFKITVRNLEISDIIRLYNRFAEEEMLEDFQLSESGLKVLFNELKEITNSRGIFFPNYFGNQRFSKNNYEVGRSLLLRDFKGAINKILCFDIPEESVKNHWENWDELLKIARAESSKEILKHLSQNSRDYVGALRRIPKRILRLYIGSFQAFLFNEALSAKVRSRFEKYFEVNYKLGRMAFPEKIIDKQN
ncbi:MAG: tRNA pseudouridine(13) synthase TruD, partial [Candidatus Micrarchaeia archaeon]